MQRFRNLRVWQKSHALVLDIYRLTRVFPRQENFCLVQQVRRAAVSIAANIVEGSKRNSDRDYSHYLNIAEGSLEEVKYYIILSKDLSYIGNEVYHNLNILTEEVGKLLRAFIKKLKA